jgi:hypothetical protein
MSFINISAKLIGKPDTSGWSQIHNFKAPEGKENYGELFILLSVINKDEARNVSELGKNITNALYEDYYSTEDNHKRLVLESLLKDNIKRFAPTQKLQAAAAILIDNKFYTVVYGQIKLYLYRRGNTSLLLKGESNLFHTLTGNLINGDMAIFGTEDTFKFLPQETFNNALNLESSDKAVEVLAPLVHSHTNTGSFGMLFIKCTESLNFHLTQASDFIPQYPTYQEFSNKSNKALNKHFSDIFKLNLSFLNKFTFQNRGEELPTVNKKKKKLALAGISLLILLILSTVIGTLQKKRHNEELAVNAKLTEAEHLLNESLDLVSLDSLQAKKLFNQSKNIISEINISNTKNPKIAELQQKISANEGKVLGERTVSPQSFVDLDLLSSGFLATSLVTSGNTIYIFDKENKRIAEVIMQTKHAEIVAGPQQISKGDNLIVYANQMYLGTNDGIYKIDKNETKVISAEWMNPILAQAYAGNIYLVNKDKKVIEKYSSITGGFAAVKQWLTEDSDDNLSEAISLSIDGSLWVLTKQGQILKYMQGNRQRFIVTGMTSGFNQPRMLYTDENFKNLYILDQNNNRIVVIDKNGSLIMEYSSDVFSKAVGISASEEQKRIYVLTEDKLMYIEME